MNRPARLSPGQEQFRESKFPFLEFRDTIIGRQAFIKGSGLQIWMVILAAQSLAFDADRVAEKCSKPVDVIQGVFQYYLDYPQEIDNAIEDNQLSHGGAA